MPGSRLASTEHSPLALVLGFQGCRGVAGLGCQAAATSLVGVWQGLKSSTGAKIDFLNRAGAEWQAEDSSSSSSSSCDLLLPLPRGLVLKQPCPAADLTCLLQGPRALSQSQALALSPLLCKYEYGHLVTRSGEGPESWQTF